MLEIGSVRRKLAEEAADGLAYGGMSAHFAALKIYCFAINPDVRVSTLAVASQVVRLLEAERKGGLSLPGEAKLFIESYHKSCKEGKSVGLLSSQARRVDSSPEIAPIVH